MSARPKPERSCFNPRTRVGCDTLKLMPNRVQAKVSIHAPAWGATAGPRHPGPRPRFQSTHPRGVRRQGRLDRRAGGRFQSTHPRGVRPLQMSLIIAAETSFNPRTRVGCDVGAGVGCRTATLFQSTHPRGVRPCPGPMWTGQRPCFNPRTRVGCDFGSNRMISSELQFQSTHPRGVRPAAFADRASRRSCFNPRTRVGCDDTVDATERVLGVSIHAPAWGATDSAGAGGHGPQGFNPRTRVGCD